MDRRGLEKPPPPPPVPPSPPDTPTRRRSAELPSVPVDRLSVPSHAELRTPTGKRFTVYNVDVEFANGERRFKQKRFNEFSSLHAALLSLSARGESKDRAAQACWQEVSQFDFPHKTMTGGAWLRERRRRKFDQFAQLLIPLLRAGLSDAPPVLADFLAAEARTKSRDHTPSEQPTPAEQAAHDHANAGSSSMGGANISSLAPHMLSGDGATLAAMRVPVPMLKWGRGAKPHWRLFRLRDDEGAISWEKKARKGRFRYVRTARPPVVTVDSIVSLTLGQRTGVFGKYPAPHLAKLCFSVVYELAGLTWTLDVCARTQDERSVFVRGIATLVSRRDARMSLNPGSPGRLPSVLRDAIDERCEHDAHHDEADRDGDAHDDGGAHSDEHGEHGDDEGGAHGAEVGASHVTASREVRTIGDGSWGQLGHGAIGDESAWQDGTVHKSPLPVIDGPEFVRNVACGGSHTVIVTGAGVVVASGRAGALGAATERLAEHQMVPSPVKVKVLVWAVACGDQHTLLLDTTGHVHAFGSNHFGQLGDRSTTSRSGSVRVPFPKPFERCVCVGAGYSFSAAVLESGHLFTWGSTAHSALGHGGGELCCADEANGCVLVPKRVDALDGQHVVDVSCGAFFGIATVVCGTAGSFSDSDSDDEVPRQLLYAWGDNSCGQLGLGDVLPRTAPACVELMRGSEGDTVCSVVCGSAHCAAVVSVLSVGADASRQLWTWGCGYPATGVRGAGNITTPRPFTLVSRGTSAVGAVSLACGDLYTAVLDTTGNVSIIGSLTMADCETEAPDATAAAAGGGTGGGAGAGPATVTRIPWRSAAVGSAPPVGYGWRDQEETIEAICGGAKHLALIVARRYLVG